MAAEVSTPRYNVGPGQVAALIRSVEGKTPAMDALEWGLLPFWASTSAHASRSINARSETAAEKPTFRAPFRYRRCLILADGFFEWQRLGRVSQAWRFLLEDESVFGFAGLWDYWHGPDGGLVETFTILTTEANPLVRPLHHRMPVILDPQHWEPWLDSRFHDVTALRQWLVPLASEKMKHYPVGDWVHNLEVDDDRCIDHLPLPPEQGQLF